MKKLWTFTLSLTAMISLTHSFTSQAEIRDVKSMQDIVSFIDKDTVVVFDLDNTLIEPVQTLGSDQFFGLLLQKAQSQGLDSQSALNCALKNAALVEPTTKVKPVENLTPDLILGLQKQGIKIIGLTARSADWKADTIKQLSSIDIDLTKTPLFSENVPVGPNSAGLYYDGVVFMADNGDKGEYLVSFLQQTHSTAKSVVFVDDKLANVQSVENALNKTDLKHIDFRYGATDAEVQALDPKLASFEWVYFEQTNTFISDANAKQLMISENYTGDWNLNCQ